MQEFPPLKTSHSDIEQSHTDFYGNYLIVWRNTGFLLFGWTHPLLVIALFNIY